MTSLPTHPTPASLSGRTDEFSPDAPFRMLGFAWFRIAGQIPALATPFYIGRGVAFHEDYRSEKHRPMPGYAVLKICLSDGGLIRYADQKQRRLVTGQATLRTVGDTGANDGFDPTHRGEWSFLGLIFRGDAAISTVRGFISRYGYVGEFSLESPLMRRMQALCNQPAHSIEMSASEGMNLVNDVLAALVRNAERDTVTTSRLRVAQAVERTIVDNPERIYSVDELSEIHGLSREHLTRIFTQEYGMPPHQYMLEMKVREAGRLLRHTSTPIKTIIRTLGFTPRTFYRVFRQITGVTPSDYRERSTEL
ncbi:helix-turn-helix domain-containing protein [Mucisphaera calidilacus]|uniref:Regulatory protein PchR n=1 Tax=Mucisphaera calidilacus TaxID=2527982 RepID=A0A518BX15_9BACT|nr:AraC family transcriptional regulator [Mucisphaera calidilacus]QDU71523.1 Regulatory protein PchR [Mucisphaera calidilacus]